MIRKGTILAALAALGLAACGSDDERGLELYGTTFGATGQLVQLDPNTGAFIRSIGPIGYWVNGLEWDHTTGKLYATTSTNDTVFPNGLIEIDLGTGAGTPIGTGAGMTVMNPTVSSTGALYAWTETGDDLVTLDKATGVATVVGNSGLSTAQHGLAFDNQDQLVFVNYDGQVYSVATGTGLPTLLGSIGVTSHHGDVHPGTGMYWGIDETPGSSTSPTRNIRVVNVASATVTTTLPTVDDLFTLTFRR